MQNTNKHRTIVLYGPSCAGKSTIREWFASAGFYSVKSWTTRKRRTHERDGEDYFFVDVDKFLHEYFNQNLFNYNKYDNEHYGICCKEFSDDVFHFSSSIIISDISSLSKLGRDLKSYDVKPIYILCTTNSVEDLLVRRAQRKETAREELVLISEFEQHNRDNKWVPDHIITSYDDFKSTFQHILKFS